MSDIDINTVISNLIGEYVKANAEYDTAVKIEEDSDYAYENTIERLELSGVILGLSIALVALGQDMTVIDSQFRIDGV